jgi:hypothetical protein
LELFQTALKRCSGLPMRNRFPAHHDAGKHHGYFLSELTCPFEAKPSNKRRMPLRSLATRAFRQLNIYLHCNTRRTYCQTCVSRTYCDRLHTVQRGSCGRIMRVGGPLNSYAEQRGSPLSTEDRRTSSISRVRTNVHANVSRCQSN